MLKSSQRLLHDQPLKMTKYQIDIVSDIVCPWCYIGHARLSKAIANHKEQFPEDTFQLSYKPFYLNPAPQVYSSLEGSGPEPPPFPIKSVSRKDYYASKFGEERSRQMQAMMIETARKEGLDFKYGGQTGPSRNGHRLVHYAQNHGGEEAQNKAMLGLWKRYFEQETDITTLETLVDIGVESGLGTAEEVKKYLESGADAKLVDEEAEQARQGGISGVPNYEIQGAWEVSGAQDPLAFERLFKRWKNMEAQGKAGGAEKSADGTACL